MWFLTFCYLTPPIWQTVYWNNCEMIYFLVMFKVFISVFIFAVRPLLFLVGSCHFTKVGVYLLKTKRLLFLIKLIVSITDKNFHFQSYFRLFLLRRVLFLQIIHRRQKKKKKEGWGTCYPWARNKDIPKHLAKIMKFHLNFCSSFPLTTTKPNMEWLIPFGCSCFGTK